jgi:glycosyltransferase involved in cell wall biosynthesis
VEKKGFRYLIDACNILRDRGLDFECTICGSGPLEEALRRQIRDLRLTDWVRLISKEITQDELPRFMHQGDLYCLPCVWASDDDVDGLPQMLMEAMACGLPVISTRLVGIPDLVIHERTGLLVEPNNSEQLAEAVVRLRNAPELAARLAEAGRQWCCERFDIWTSLKPLLDKFRQKLAARDGLAAPVGAVAAGALG